MSHKLKLISAFLVVAIAAAILIYRNRPWPPLPNSPVALAELIDKSDLILHAKVLKVENTPPLYTGTNRWLIKAARALRPDQRSFETAHLQVLQTIKGRATDRVLADYPIDFTRAPVPETDWSEKSMIVFLYWQRGAYHPVAYSYGTRLLKRKQAEDILRLSGEFVSMDRLTRRLVRQRARTEWFVKLIENADTRWDGAASALYDYAKHNQTLTNLPPDLLKRIETVAFRNEPLGPGDEILLDQLASLHPRKVAHRILNYFNAAIVPSADKQDNFPQPWRCHGAMQLLARIASMPEQFKTDFNNAPYPNLSTPQARQHFINTYLPEIHTRLIESGASPEARLAAQ